MKMLTIAAGIAIAGVAIGIAIYMRGNDEAPAVKAPLEPPAKRAASDPGGSGGVMAAPVPVAVPKPPPAKPSARMSALMVDITRGRNYKEILERLQAAQQRTPEENYALAEILARCAKGAEAAGAGFGFRPRLGGTDRRQQLATAISDKDPDRERRLAAFDAINVDPCSGLENLQATAKEVRELVATAAAAGDPKARAYQVQGELWDQMRGPRNPGEGPRTMRINDAQLDTLRDVLRSSDPGGVVMAARIFTMPLGDLSIRAGPGEATLDNSAFSTAAQLVACDLGDACGADSPRMLEACALYGNCNAADLREHIFYYGSSAASAQNANLYYTELQRARAGDWSYFNFNRGPAPRVVTSPRPR
jgi:hypothetical protein